MVNDQQPTVPDTDPRLGQPTHPYAHLWPAYTAPPPKPEQPLRRALLWTAMFSLLGVLLMGAAVAAAFFVLYVLIWVFIASLGEDAWDFWGELADVGWGSAVAPLLMVTLAVSVVIFAVCAGVLLLMRRAESVRRWASPLQGLTACGIVYIGGGGVLMSVGQLASMLTGNG